MKRIFIQQRLRPLFSVILIVLLKAQAFSQPVNIIVSPASSNVLVNQNFTVDVKADFTAAGTLNVIEAYVNFNVLDLQVVSTSVPSSTVTLLPGESVAMDVDAVNGHVDHGRFRSSPTGHPNADFVLFSITFKALRVPPGGTTSITFNTANPRRTIALEGAAIVSNQIISGSVNVQNCTPPTATISGGSASATCNAQPVSLKLSAATGTAPYTVVVNGNTYSNKNVGDVLDVVDFPTYNFWNAPPTPAVTNNQDPEGSIEVGVKFKSSVAGFVKGIRYYVGSSGVGQSHTGKLWNAGTGTLVASAIFTPGAGGWQQVLFSTPVAITANTTYLASCFSFSGYYNETDNVFTSNIANGPLTILADGTGGLPNGLYRYGAGMPNNGFSATNYFVDVIFAQGTNSFNLTSITDATGCNSSGSLQTLNVTSFDCSTLPVTLLNLSASPAGRKVTLRWATSSENNNRGFDVQRSTDGANWATIGFVAGVGNSSLTTNYSYLDDNLESRKYYYRLNQWDLDGRSKYSVIVTATLGSKGEYVLGQNYPNPFRNETTIQYTIPQAGNVNMTLFDISGRAIKVLVNGSKDAGTHAISFNTGNLTKGVYYYRLQAGDFSDVKKLTIQ